MDFDNFDFDKKGSNFVERLLNNEIGNDITGTGNTGINSLIYTIAGYIRGGKAFSRTSSKQVIGSNSTEFTNFITKNNFWFKGVLSSSGEFFFRGNEQKVYLDEQDPNYVFKVNNLQYYEYSLLNYLYSLLLHNYFFPDTSYKLIGFIYENERTYPVVRQRYIRPNENTNIQDVETILSTFGFKRVRPMNSYENRELKITLTDLSVYNILTRDGILYFIDTVFYLEVFNQFKKGGPLTPIPMHTETCGCSHHDTFAEGGKVKKIIKRNLPINVTYKMIDAYYTGGITDNPDFCENCGRPIANVAIIKDENGKTFHVGMDCAETLSSIKNSTEFMQADNDFKEATAFRTKIKNIYKKHPTAVLNVHNTYSGKVSIEVRDNKGAYLGSFSFPKQFVFKYLPDYKAKISNPDKNNFYPKLDEEQTSEIQNINISGFKLKDQYPGPIVVKVGDYTIEISRRDKTHTTSDGKQITNNHIMIEAFKNGELIASESTYMANDIKRYVASALNKYEFDNFTEGETFAEGGHINSDDAFKNTSRFRPMETAVFDPPITGPTGAKLLSYSWAFEWTMVNNWEGELVSKRQSDWDQAVNSEDTGKNIVHQFTVQMPNGELKTVSSESALILMGYADRKAVSASAMPSLISAVKTLAKQKMQLAILEEQERAFNEAEQKVNAMAKPPIIETEEKFGFPHLKQQNKDGEYNFYMMGDAWYRQDNPYDYDHVNNKRIFRKLTEPTKHTIEQLTWSWKTEELKKLGFERRPSTTDIKNRIARQERKIKQITEQANKKEFAEGGYIPFHTKEELIGKKWKVMFPENKYATPSTFRAALKNYEKTLERLAENNYTLPKNRNYDERVAKRMEENLPKFKYLASIRLDNSGTIIDVGQFADGGPITKQLSEKPGYIVPKQIADQHYKKIGSGSSRFVYDMGDDTVLKLARNIKGIAQNQTESNSAIKQKYGSIVAKVIESDPQGKWVIQQKAKPVTQTRFEQLLPGYNMDDFFLYLKDLSDGENFYNKDFFAQKVKMLIRDFDLDRFDIAKESAWGEIDGKIVLMDYGLNMEASRKLYGVSYKDGGNIDNQDFIYFDFSPKSSNFDYKLVQDEIRNVIFGKSKVRHGDLIQTIAGYLRTSSGASIKAKKEKQYKNFEKKLLKHYILENNLWVDEKILTPYLSEGAEQKVYFKGDHVLKTNNTFFYTSWEDYFTSLLLHNYFFPDTAYELIGFVIENDQLRSVVKQSFVKETSITDLNFVREHLFKNDFLPERNNDYLNPDLGIILEDLHDENVLTENGVLFFIDTVFFVKHPEVYFKRGGKITETQTAAKKSLQAIEGNQHKGMSVSPAVLQEQEAKLQELLEIEARENADIEALHELDKKTTDPKEKGDIWQKKKVAAQLKALRLPVLISQKNIISCIKNGGTLISFTDKMGLDHHNIPDYRKINTAFIGVDQDTILSDPLPPYMPLINEDVFKDKGYIFDVIRIEPDGYLLAVNGYEQWADKKWNNEARDYVGTIHPTDAQQGYIMVTLDQLALINEYYIVKAKALLQKDADDETARSEKYYDSLRREQREKHLNQPGYYRVLPAAVKKKITEAQWNSFTLEEKESYYKPFKKYGPKRMETRLDSTEMWKSFHYMFNRFVDPEALSYKKPNSYTTYGHEKAFEYWHMFRDFLNWKLKDIKVQRETISEVRLLAIETSFGESNTDDVLKEKYGILVKRQDGSKIKPTEIDQIQKAWVAINNTFGNLSELARTNNLKISHTGTKYVFSSKAAGVYVPDKQTIAVSNKFGDLQFQSIMAHEVAHWIDHQLGKTTGKRHATDDYESTAGQVARLFRKHMNEASDSDYTNSTAECWARAMEQFFAITTQGNEATLVYSGKPLEAVRTYFTEANYVGKAAFETEIKPLIEKFLTENAIFLNYGLAVD